MSGGRISARQWRTTSWEPQKGERQQFGKVPRWWRRWCLWNSSRAGDAEFLWCHERARHSCHSQQSLKDERAGQSRKRRDDVGNWHGRGTSVCHESGLMNQMSSAEKVLVCQQCGTAEVIVELMTQTHHVVRIPHGTHQCLE